MTTTDWTTDAQGTGQYAEVNGINLYFESHGAGRPLALYTAARYPAKVGRLACGPTTSILPLLWVGRRAVTRSRSFPA